MVNSRVKEHSASKTRPVGRLSKKQLQAASEQTNTETLSQNPTALQVTQNPVQLSHPKPCLAYRGAPRPPSNEVPAVDLPSDVDAAAMLMGFASTKSAGSRTQQPRKRV